MVIITMLYFRDNRDMSYNHMIYVLSPVLILSRILNLTTLPRILCTWSFCYATYLVNLDLIIVYCRLDITVRFVSVWWRTLQTTWIILMERNVCNFLACFLWFFSVYLVLIPFNSLMVILHYLHRSKSAGHVYASWTFFSQIGTVIGTSKCN
jgi:hypothetical protein